MAAVSVPPPPPPPPIFSAVNDLSSNQSVSVSTNKLVNDTVYVKEKAGTVPLTPAQLRNCSKEWSLAGDAGLLLYLQEFSHQILSKTTDIEKLVDNVYNITKGSGVKVHNTFNDFLMLSSSQFIENRVYDEETVNEKVDKELLPKKSKTREELEAEVIPRFKEAVDYGFTVLDNAFITMEVKPIEDSDEESNQEFQTHVSDPIIEPKDVYESRRLPHLIGTAEFLHDETLGLLELPSDDEEDKGTLDVNKHAEESSDESSDEEFAQESSESNEDYSSDESVKTKNLVRKESVTKLSSNQDGKVNVDDKHNNKYDSSDSEQEDLFGEKKQINKKEESEEIVEKKVEVVKSKTDLQSELASKLGIARKMEKSSENESEVKNEANQISQQITSSRKSSENKSVEEVTPNLLKKKSCDEVTAKVTKNVKVSKENTSVMNNSENDDELFGLFGPPKRSESFGNNEGMFGKKKGLFSDAGSSLFDEPEEDLFGETSAKQKSKPANSLQDSIPGFHTKKESFSSPAVVKTPPVVKGLFDDEEEVNKPSQKTIPRKKTLEFFEDDDADDLFGEKKQTSKNVTEPKTDVSKPSEVNKEKLQTSSASKLQTSLSSNLQTSSSINKKPFSLFDDDLEDDSNDIFASLAKTESQKTTSSKPLEKSVSNKAAVEDSNDQSMIKPLNQPSFKKQTQVSANKKFSFGSDNSDDDLFSNKTKIPAKSKEVTGIENPSVIKNETIKTLPSAKTRKVDSLFDDDVQDDLFSIIKNSDTSNDSLPTTSTTEDGKAGIKSKKPIGGVSLFGGINPLSEQKKIAETTKINNNENNDNLVSSKNNDNLVSSKNSDLPASRNNSSVSKNDIKPVTTKSVDNPDVFGKTSKSIFEDDIDDLFSVNKKLDVSNAQPPPAASDEFKDGIKAKKPIGGVSLFGGINPLPEKTKFLGSIEPDVDDNDVLFLPQAEIKPSSKNDIIKPDNNSDNYAVNKLLDTSSKATAIQPPSTVTAASKKIITPFGSDSEDDLFSSSKPKQIKNISKVVESAPGKEVEKTIKTKPLNSQQTSKKASVFDFSSDDDEDIFSTKSKSVVKADKVKKSVETTMKKENLAVSAPVQKKVESNKSTLFDDIEDDLFSKMKTASVIPPDSKKIDVFPNLAKDPLAETLKSNDDVKDVSTDIFNDQKDTKKSLPDLKFDQNNLFEKSNENFDSVDSFVPPISTVDSKVSNNLFNKSESGIGKLQGLLNLNPTKMIPGQVYNRKSSLTESPTFDEPPKAKTLDNIVKTRVRGNGSRRPPTRKSQHNLDKEDFNDEFVNNISESSSYSQDDFLNPSRNNEPLTVSPYQESTMSQQNVSIKNNLLENDIFSSKYSKDAFKENIFSDAGTLKNELDPNLFESQQENKLSSLAFTNTLTSANVFNAGSKNVNLTEKNEKSIDDIFASESDVFNFSSKNSLKKSKEKKIDETSDDELFSSKNQTKKSLSVEKENTVKKVKKKSANLFDEEKSIFDDVVPSSKRNKNKKVDYDIFGQTNEIDDIFSTQPKTTKSAKKISKPIKKTEPVSIFDDPLSK
ncbi:WASH complex subunit 2A isoform X1 [Hydra vulgaris]|uniref:WASH complex subunit 2A isoform X1 n=1 Tax=Hydra vulgaris TaxID=6087 RepID=UPI001F5E6F76|nr:WASH complex subunit 2C [Hydra vulgaris]